MSTLRNIERLYILMTGMTRGLVHYPTGSDWRTAKYGTVFDVPKPSGMSEEEWDANRAFLEIVLDYRFMLNLLGAAEVGERAMKHGWPRKACPKRAKKKAKKKPAKKKAKKR